MSKYSVVWRLAVIALALVALALFGLYWYYAGVVSQTVAAGVFGVSLSLQIVGYSLPVGALLAAGLLGYLAVFKSYFIVKSWEAMTRLQLNEAEAVGFSVHSVSIKKSAVITAPGRQPVMLIHPSQDQLALPPAHEEKPNVIDVMVGLDRCMLIGGTGSGKSNLLKHYVSRLVGQGANLTIIDPHSPSDIVGVDVVGSGLNFGQIEAKLVAMMLDIDHAYKTGRIAQNGDMGQGNRWVIVEEFYDIHSELGDVAGEFLRSLLVRGRKAGYRFCLVSQNDSVGSLGMKGDSGLLAGSERVEVRYDIRTGERLATVGRRAANLVECDVPGIFPDFPKVPNRQLDTLDVGRLNDTQKAIAMAFIATGETVKSELYKLANVSKNGANSRFIDGLLDGRLKLA